MGEKRVKRVLAGLVVGGVLALLAAWYFGVDAAQLKGYWRALELWLMAHPVLLFVALVFLPGFPVPSSALLITAGIVWRDHPVLACLACVLAFALNMTWTYGVAAGPGRRLVEKFLATTTLQIPNLPRGDHLRLILIMRLTPGMPFFFQNYVMGFLRPPFRMYLLVSVLCNAPVVCGIVLSGAGLANGRLLPLLAGLAVLVLTGVLTHSARRWLARRREPTG